MGKASRTKQSVSRQERVAAQRAAAKRAEQRRNLLMAGGAVFVVLVVVAVFLVVKITSNNNSANNTASNGPTGTSLSSLVSQVTSVPASTLEAVGAGAGVTKPTSITGSALTSNGKPEILYEGAEYCPYCAAERWSMIVALSRFGTFSGLKTTHSAAVNGGGNKEPYPNTPTWTFYKSSYSSQYVTFTPVETQTNVPDSKNGYTLLQTPTSAQNALLSKYDAPPYVQAGAAGSIPFVDFGNKYLISGASYTPQVLSGLTWNQIAADLSNPSSPVAKAIDGAANYMTAAICKLTGNQPANVCTTTIQGLQSQI